ncbi:hypothetical protein IGS68_19145 [Skermanella sp. TT6]|uniref:Uncharacterized protein n=1 Tax=Skermanella cutis TaxID=2775420 RepID=A0ABX7B1K7_9PROT|nr:hypothetical protein [Skermanella sp. TT6]QQP88161.1 hypothetical protein IGS68_19145 [Skermanella sp. TT6]
MTNAEFIKRIVPVWVAAAVIGGGLGYLLLVAMDWPETTPTARWAATVEACDRAVHLLLTTDNMVELERSKYLIEKLTCSVRRRLEPAS